MNHLPNSQPNGFTITQLLTTMAIIGILSSIVVPTYSKYSRNSRLHHAQSMLLQNAHFMEKFYSKQKSFKANSTTWPALPITQTDSFCIRPQGNARGANADKFTIKAVARDKNQEPRVIKINEDLVVQVCESSTSSCDDKKNFFSAANGTDRKCQVIS